MRKLLCALCAVIGIGGFIAAPMADAHRPTTRSSDGWDVFFAVDSMCGDQRNAFGIDVGVCVGKRTKDQLTSSLWNCGTHSRCLGNLYFGGLKYYEAYTHRDRLFWQPNVLARWHGSYVRVEHGVVKEKKEKTY